MEAFCRTSFSLQGLSGRRLIRSRASTSPSSRPVHACRGSRRRLVVAAKIGTVARAPVFGTAIWVWSLRPSATMFVGAVCLSPIISSTISIIISISSVTVTAMDHYRHWLSFFAIRLCCRHNSLSCVTAAWTKRRSNQQSGRSSAAAVEKRGAKPSPISRIAFIDHTAGCGDCGTHRPTHTRALTRRQRLLYL